MPAYVIVETDVTDPEQYERYKAAGAEAVAAAGGRYLVRGGELAVLEGRVGAVPAGGARVRGPRGRQAVVRLRALPAGRTLREGAARLRMVAVQGVSRAC